MRSTRLDEMEKFIVQHETVSMDELCGHFGVSMVTVRRDITELQRKGVVTKIYGGVSAHKPESLTPFDVRKMTNQEAKRAIAACAAEFVHDNDIIFIDSGSTSLLVLEAIKQKSNITVVTHSLPALTAAAAIPGITLFALPGQYYPRTNSFTGMETIRALRSFNITTAFMGASAFSPEHGVSNSSQYEYEIKHTALQRAQKNILLVDSEKIGRTAVFTYGQISDFACVFTDKDPGEECRAACMEADAKLIVAGV